MVLLLAALYTYYQKIQEQKRNNSSNNGNGEENNNRPRRGGIPRCNSNSTITAVGAASAGCIPCLPAVVVPGPSRFASSLYGSLPITGGTKHHKQRRNKNDIEKNNYNDICTMVSFSNSSIVVAGDDDDNELHHQSSSVRATVGEEDSPSLASQPAETQTQETMVSAAPSSSSGNNNKDEEENGNNYYSDTVFNDEVREEWINAVFGRDFLNSDSGGSITTSSKAAASSASAGTTVSGVGLSGIRSYVAHSVHIPHGTKNNNDSGASYYGNNDETPRTSHVSSRARTAAPTTTTKRTSFGSDSKLGMTMSRLPLGLYVRRVEKASEAYFAGIQEGSVLVSVNGIPFLAEPSRQALERIWQYEGVFQQQEQGGEFDGGGASTSTASWQQREEQKEAMNANSTDANNVQPSSSFRVKEPVAIVFIHKGQLTTKLMLCPPPWGISWAPCGNFCLVKRVYSHAAEAGVKRGSIVAAVNGLTFRTLDHADLAMTLRDVFSSDQDLHLTLCFSPAASRTGHYERQLQQTNSGVGGATSGSSQGHHHSPNGLSSLPASWMTKTHDGVEVKFHRLEYAISSLCNAGIGLGGGSGDCFKSNNNSGSVNHHKLSAVEDLAMKVAAGDVIAPTGVSRAGNSNIINKSRLSDSHVAYYRDGINISNNRVYSPCPPLSTERLFEVWDPLDSLLYCLRMHAAEYDEGRFATILSHQQHAGSSSVEAIRSLVSRPGACGMVGSFLLQFIGIICAPVDIDPNVGEEKEDEKKMEDGITDHRPHLPKGRAQELTSILLKVSRKDEGFCQRLYFLLRSYISTLETPRPQSSREEGGSRNLVALLNCLELLRFAEKELASRSNTSASPNRVSSTDEASLTVTLSTSVAKTIEQLPPPPPIVATVSSPAKFMDTESSEKPGSKKKKKSFFGRFRKKKPLKSLTRSSQRVESKTSVGSDSALPVRNSGRNQARTVSVSPRRNRVQLVRSRSTESLTQSPSVMYENMSDFLGELDRICGTIERSLQKSFRQKMADWAMQPWSPSKDSALAEVTAIMRENLEEVNSNSNQMLLVNPVDSSELLSSVDYDECYILPTAHYPLLLTFNVSERRSSDQLTGEERVYRTKVELVSLKGYEVADDQSFVLHAAVAGSISESGMSQKTQSDTHFWQKGAALQFESRSSWGAPQTLSLRLSSRQVDTAAVGSLDDGEEIGYGWVDLSAQFNMTNEGTTTTCYADIWPVDSRSSSFDEHGDLPNDTAPCESIELKLKITTESIGFGENNTQDGLTRKRMLLYKHAEDLRQESFAIQFISTCDAILKASGLDMKLLTFQCIPVGTKRGFIEWVPGSVPLSEICQPFAGSLLGKERRSSSDMSFPSMFKKAGLSKYESLRRLGGQQNESLRRLSRNHGSRGSFCNNPIQDYLRSVAYDPNAPYLIRKEVMDTYVKSCAGYSVLMYILGVGDRHLDNLLLHQSGSFFHCDFSFILGSDPKMYLPVRVTEDMVFGMGGVESDNYARFLSMVGAAFLCIRRPENVRLLLNVVRLMQFSCVPDISENQTTEKAALGIRDRLQLDLSDQDAVAYIEELVESSQSSKMWMAVDAIHSLGKKF